MTTYPETIGEPPQVYSPSAAGCWYHEPQPLQPFLSYAVRTHPFGMAAPEHAHWPAAARPAGYTCPGSPIPSGFRSTSYIAYGCNNQGAWLLVRA
ncbi:hypothetical protein ACM614_15480 [Streptomyces sp. 12297]